MKTSRERGRDTFCFLVLFSFYCQQVESTVYTATRSCGRLNGGEFLAERCLKAGKERRKKEEEKNSLLFPSPFNSIKMLRKTAAGAAADAAATVASSSPSKCGPDFQIDHKHSSGTGHAAKRPQAQQRRRSVSERTMLLAAAIAGSMVFSLARHFWLSASSSPGE